MCRPAQRDVQYFQENPPQKEILEGLKLSDHFSFRVSGAAYFKITHLQAVGISDGSRIQFKNMGGRELDIPAPAFLVRREIEVPTTAFNCETKIQFTGEISMLLADIIIVRN